MEEVNLQCYVMIQINIFFVFIYAQYVIVIVIGFKSIEYFHVFPIVEVTANYAEIGRVGKLMADFQIFWFSQYCHEQSIMENQE